MSTATQDRTEWLAERRKGVGGSDAPVVAGLSKWKSPHELYLEKRGELPAPDLDDVEHIRWGIRLEDAVADEYAERTGRKVRRVNRVLQHPEYPFMLASLDRDVVGEKRILEIKTTGDAAFRANEWGAEGSDEVPDVYFVQVQHYLAVTRAELADLAVLIGGQRMKIYEIPRDDAFIADLIEAERGFWTCVESGTPPAIDWSHPTALDMIKRRYPGTDGTSIILPRDAALLHAELEAVKIDKKELEDRGRALTAELLSMMGTAAVGLLPGGVGSYRRREVAAAEIAYTRKPYVDFRYSKSNEGV